MDPNTLRERLAQLHVELTEAHRDNPHAREHLGEILPDLSRLVDEPASLDAASHASLPGRLERVAVQFEADHPDLAASARSLVDLLGKVGL